MKQICVLGEGAWGTAIATLLAENGHKVHLWCHDSTVADTIIKNRTTRYAPHIKLHENIIPYTDIESAIKNASIIFEAVPVMHLRSILEKTQSFYDSEQTWVVLSKGIEQKSLLLPSQIIETVFSNNPKTVVISGPSFAHDLIRKQPTAVTIASANRQSAAQIQQLLNTDYFHLFYSSDIIGVQLGGALKNVIAMAIGMLDGAGYTDNTKAWFLTQGLQEIAQLAYAVGAHRETMYGLSGLGDLVLTAMGKHSKNYALGRRLGAEEQVQTIINQVHTMPEGINTVQAAQQLIQKHNLDLPLMRGIYQVIFEQKKVENIVREILRSGTP